MFSVKCRECDAIYEATFHESVVRDSPRIECVVCGCHVLEGPHILNCLAELVRRGTAGDTAAEGPPGE